MLREGARTCEPSSGGRAHRLDDGRRRNRLLIDAERSFAATLGSRDIGNDTLTTQVDEVLDARGTGAGAPDAALVADILQRLVITELVDEGAARNGVVVTQGRNRPGDG